MAPILHNAAQDQWHVPEFRNITATNGFNNCQLATLSGHGTFSIEAGASFITVHENLALMHLDEVDAHYIQLQPTQFVPLENLVEVVNISGENLIHLTSW